MSTTGTWGNRHQQRFKTLDERFHEKYLVNESTGCWEWQAALFQDTGRPSFANRIAYRAGYELLIGPIPEGLVLDHLCCNPICVNPSHLQPVTQEENRRRQAARQTHCKHGHELAGENLALVRVCRTCRTATEARHIAKQRKERAA